MRKIMFIGAMAALLFACGDKTPDGDKTIGKPLKLSGQVTLDPDYDYSDIVKIKAVVSGDGETTYDVATANWNNGNFSITLPALKKKYLTRAITEDMPDGMTVSDTEVMGASAVLSLRNADNDDIGMLYYGYLNESIDYVNMTMQSESIEAQYILVDRDVTISGDIEVEELGTMNYDVRLKKGWNVVYACISMTIRVVGEDIITEATMSMTTTKPNANYIWEAYMGNIVYDIIYPKMPQKVRAKQFKLF